jgi:arylsulfotransferase ASST
VSTSLGLTRRQFVRRAVGGVVAAGALQGRFGRLGEHDALARTWQSGGGVHDFVSRPDLQPPVVTVLQSGGGRLSSGHLFLAPSSGPGERGTMIVDNAGAVVWFRPTQPKTAMNFRAALYKGEPVLTWWEGKSKHGLGIGEHVVFDRSYREVARFPAGNGLQSDLHEFVVTPAGTALVTAYDIATTNLSRLGGRRRGRVVEGVVQELEVPSARVLFEWRSLDHVAAEESYGKVGNPFAYDYFHVNSIDVDDDGNLLVSARNTWAVYKIGRRDGRVIWRLGGRKSDFRMGKGTSFAWQHDARHHAGGNLITVFDNAAAPQVEPESRALAIALDTARMRATLLRQYEHRPSVVAHALGSAQRFSGGNMLVGWGTQPYFTEYAPDGAVLLDATLPRGGQSYRTLRFPWSGTPSDRPALAARPAGGGTLLYASWNGATEVSSWQVLAGADPSRLTTGLAVRKRGFETPVQAPAGARYAAVTALDRTGKPLGRSPTIAL